MQASSGYPSLFGETVDDDEGAGWRLSDRLYELSLEAEEQEKRQRRADSLQAEALHEAQRERDRLRVQLEDAREELRRVVDKAAKDRAAAREREDDLAREFVVMRAEAARHRRGRPSSELDGIDVVYTDTFEDESLETMAARGDEVGLRSLLSPEPRAQAALAYRRLLSSALIAAAEAGQNGTCKMLVRRGALDDSGPPARRKATGWTALHAAASSRAADVVETLVVTEACAPRPPERSSAPPTEDPLDLADSRGRTALMLAAERKAADVVRALMRAGADAELRDEASAKGARDLCGADAQTLAALDSPAERFWNASAAGNRAWRRKDFRAALFHFAAALDLAAALENDVTPADTTAESAPSGVDLARLELNCAKAALRLGRGLEAAERAESALQRHRAATRGGVYMNALAVRAECHESVYDFGSAGADFDDLAKLAEASGHRDEARKWRDRARLARDSRDATHYAVLGVGHRADENDVRRAYRRASMRWHPDRRRSNDRPGTAKDDRARAERHFRRINDAKEALLDSYKRAVYDVEHRRRLAAEAERADDAWPWHAVPHAANGCSEDLTGPSESVRYTLKWVAAAPSPASSQPKEQPPVVKEAAVPEKPEKHDNESSAQQEELSSRLRRYEDELRRQRAEIDKEAAAQPAPTVHKPDDKAAAPRPDRRFAQPTNGREEMRYNVVHDDGIDDEDDDDLGTSLANALANEDLMAARSADDGSVNDLGAQLHDAAEWFDMLDARRTGELDMQHFDELVDRLGLRDILSDEEMQRQRFFADPVGAGVLRRGAFLGWFAVRVAWTRVSLAFFTGAPGWSQCFTPSSRRSRLLRRHVDCASRPAATLD